MKKTTIALALTLLFLPALAQAEKASSKQQHPDLSGSWGPWRWLGSWW